VWGEGGGVVGDLSTFRSEVSLLGVVTGHAVRTRLERVNSGGSRQERGSDHAIVGVHMVYLFIVYTRPQVLLLKSHFSNIHDHLV